MSDPLHRDSVSTMDFVENSENHTRLVTVEGGIPAACEPAALEHGMEPASVGFISSAESDSNGLTDP